MPPSIPAVVYASVAAVSTGALFAAAVLPAILMTLALCLTVYVWSRGKTEFRGEPYDWAAVRRAFLRALPAAGAPVIILGGILGGFFTPTEAAGIGALYMLALALSYRTVTVRDMALIFRDTAVVTAQITIIIGASALLSWILAKEQVPQAVAQGLLGLTDNPLVFLLVINVVLDRHRHDPRADLGSSHHHAHPATGRGRVRDRSAPLRIDRDLQPHDRPA